MLLSHAGKRSLLWSIFSNFIDTYDDMDDHSPAHYTNGTGYLLKCYKSKIKHDDFFELLLK